MNLNALQQSIRQKRVAVVGDFCLDAYWRADMQQSQLSRETPHHPLPVVEERYSPGGAGNVACCLAALKPREVVAIGLLGQDWRGDILQCLLREQGVEVSHLLPRQDVITNTYIKPLRAGISDVVYEDPRIDFENRQPLPLPAEEALLAALSHARDCDVLLVCDQMVHGCITTRVRHALEELSTQGLPVVVDSRHNIGLYRHVIIKPNEVEARAATGLSDLASAAQLLAQQTGKEAIVTLGENGCLVATQEGDYTVPAFLVEGPIDVVGAGDAFLSAFGLAYAAGQSVLDACLLGNAAAAVVVQKINTTGTASWEEMKAIW